MTHLILIQVHDVTGVPYEGAYVLGFTSEGVVMEGYTDQSGYIMAELPWDGVSRDVQLAVECPGCIRWEGTCINETINSTLFHSSLAPVVYPLPRRHVGL
jgi:hypothetical protein